MTADVCSAAFDVRNSQSAEFELVRVIGCQLHEIVMYKTMVESILCVLGEF